VEPLYGFTVTIVPLSPAPWCPNGHDEAQYPGLLYKQHRARAFTRPPPSSSVATAA
jgi:hypothetical protein